MKRSASVLGILALLLLCAPWASAQETRGSIEGVVKDSSGAVLPGVTVEARAAAGGVSSAVSDATGTYRFPALTPGQYEVAANLAGFQASKVENVLLQLGQILKVNFALQVSGVSESVQVTAESPTIDVKQNAASLSIQKEIIDLIPKGRDFTSVVTTAPGTNNEGRGGGIMIDGSSGSENRFIVDGLDTTSLRQGTSSTSVLTDFVSEVQVKSSGYNAEYRAATGGVVSAITRSGSNAFHGEVGSYYTDNVRLRGAIRQSLRLDPLDATKIQYTTGARDPGKTVEPVLTIGGPIKTNSLWFFAGYVPQLTDNERTVTFTQNRAAGPQTFSNHPKDHNINYNVTAQLTTSLRTKFAGSHEPTIGAGNNALSLPGLEPDYISTQAGVRGDRVADSAFRTSTANPANFPSVLYTNTFTDSYRSVTDWVVSPKLYVNLTAGYLAYGSRGQTLTSFNTNTRRTFSQSPNVFPEVPASLIQPSGYSDGIANSRTVLDDYNRIGVNTDATYYGNWKGQHTLKAGFQYERLGNEVNIGQQAPNITLSWNQSRTTNDVPQRIVRGTYGFFTALRQYTEGRIHANNYGIFLQDAWTVNNKLTMNLGIRTEQEDVPSYRPENPGIHFSFKDKFAPRVGFAYDVRGDAKWKAYGSWGMFYDISKLEMPRGSFGGDHWISYYYTLDTFNWPSIDCSDVNGSKCTGGTFIEQVDFRHVSNTGGGDTLVEPNMKPIRTQEFTLGADHELNPVTSVGVRYSHKWLNTTIEDVGIVVPGVGEVFYISNPGEGISTNLLRDKGGCPTCPNQPLPKRVYDGVEFRVIKRYAHRWYLNSSYLWSRLNGNYSGLASSDENGRTSPSVDRFFDGQYMSFDQTGTPVYGPLGTDRPHQFKVQASYSLPWGTQAGVFYFLASGLPQQQQVTVFGVPVFNLGRNSLGRTPTFSQTDLTLSHQLKLFAHTNVTVEANVINLFDQQIVTSFFNTPYRDAIPFTSTAQFFQGFDADAIAAATPSVRKDPRFRLDNGWQGARSVRFAAKFRF